MSKTQPTKPFFIEASQFTGGAKNAAAIIRWVRAEHGRAQWIAPSVQSRELMGLKTKNGVAIVEVGDWIVQGLDGDFYPIKPNIFSEMFAERFYSTRR